MYFIKKEEGKDFVNHIDGVKTNNKAKNLEWVTPSENIIHAFKNGLSSGQRGEKSYSSCITEAQALEIYKLAQEGVLTQKEIAQKYNITRSNVSAIKRGKSWSYITKQGGKNYEN
jgi:DNA invertase Pin-like site-specific DNA recombinase